MLTSLANVSLIVRDYDEAIKWFTEVLRLELRMDGSMGDGYRFVTVGVKGQDDVSIVLHKPHTGDSAAGGSIHGLLFHTSDCRRDAEDFRQRGVKITLEPQEVPWGVQAVFEDLYTNSHVLLEPSSMTVQQGSGEI